MIEQEIEIMNRLGLHARAAAKLVRKAGEYRSAVHVICDDEAVDAKSILGLMGLAAAQGTTLSVRCAGEDEAAALAGITALIADRFGEER